MIIFFSEEKYNSIREKGKRKKEKEKEEEYD